MHIDIVVIRLRDAWGLLRAGHRIQAAVEKAAALSVRAKRLVSSNLFLSCPGAPVQVRDRSGEAFALLRKHEMISPEEVREAIMQVVSINFGAKRAEIASAVARLLGISSTTAGFRLLVDAQIRLLRRRGHITLDSENVTLQPSA